MSRPQERESQPASRLIRQQSFEGELHESSQALQASVVINGSVNPHIGMPTSSVYAATKAAMISLTKTLSGELISRGIFHFVRSKEEQAAFIKQIPAGRFGQPSEIANAAVFLASDEAAFTVGAELLIDGGMSL